jgi:hypothetical protein
VSSSARLLGAAILAFVLFVLAVKLLPSRAVEPVLASRGSPAPTVQASAAETSAAEPLAIPASETPPPPLTVRDLGAMLMGPQAMYAGGINLTFDVQEPGWEQFGNVYISKSFRQVNEADVIVYWTPIGGDQAWPCSPLLGDGTGLSVDDQATALRGADGVDWGYVEESADTSIGGLPAGHLRVTVRDPAGCGLGYFFDWQQSDANLAWQGPRPGDVMQIWVADVSGARVLIAAISREAAAEQAHREVQQLVDSIRFQ